MEIQIEGIEQEKNLFDDDVENFADDDDDIMLLDDDEV